jgi:GNAT superfamily N-acetyltransferase
MLLSEETKRGSAAQYLLALQEDAPSVVGAAAYFIRTHAIVGIRIRVIRTHRRRAVGSLLMNRIIEIARAKQLGSLAATADAVNEPDAEPFLLHQGFTRVNRVTLVEGLMVSAMRVILPLAERLRRSGHVPADSTIVPLSQSPRNAVASLYVAELARNPFSTPWSLLDELSGPRFAKSPVLLVNGHVTGFLLWDLDGDLSTIPARIVAPDHQGGPTNVLLMDDALRNGWDDGARRIQFEIPEKNSDTEKLARRFDTKVIGGTDHYFRKLLLP